MTSDPETPPPAVAPEKTLLLLCREEFQTALHAEIAAAIRLAGAGGPMKVAFGEKGLIRVDGESAGSLQAAHPDPFIFERQRLVAAQLIPMGSLKAMARQVLVDCLPPVSRARTPWTVHAFASNPDSPDSLSRKVSGFEQVFLDLCRERFTAVFRRYKPPRELPADAGAWVLQLCMAPAGLWGSAMLYESLSDRYVGGMHRMPLDPHAPSRSYLKIEEAFDLMGEEPRPGQTVVDLGAAPGGWTYAFLKRGCHVTAVDHAELRLTSLGGLDGRFTHLKENGISYTPPRQNLPVDWLVSDMLVAAGTNIGMLRKWMDNRWMRHFVFNVKLPQEQPLEALQPMIAYLEKVPDLRWRMRQLYHDRREVTVWGWLPV
jgi:23S rRNA (cytidine2498-2'-O)-methyltransferase